NGSAACATSAWTYTLSPTLATDGIFAVTVTQSDTSGNTGTTGAQSLAVDKTPPVVSLTTVNGTPRPFPYTSTTIVTTFGGACGAAIGDSATVSVTITCASTQNGTASCTAGTWTFTPTTALSTSGTYTLAAVQTDLAGNTGASPNQQVTVDAT